MEGAYVFIIILVAIMLFQRWSHTKENEEVNNRLANLDLNEKTSLRFVKCEHYWGQRYVQFYNPVVRDWWYLPKVDSRTLAVWSFKQRGCNKGCVLDIYKIADNEIEETKKKFKTLADVQEQFEKCNDKYFQSIKGKKLTNLKLSRYV